MPAPAKEIRLLLVDDSQLIRCGARAVIEHHESEPRLVVVGEASSVKDAIACADRHRPDLVLLDLHLPDGFGYEACREILRRHPQTRVLVLTSHMEDHYLYEAITAGAHGYLLKETEPKGLLEAIRRIASGESIIGPDLTARVLNLMRTKTIERQASRLFTSLSPQEKRVLQLVAQGKTNKEIGDQLGLSDNTVKNYLGSVFEKLKVKSRAQAAALYTQRQADETRPKQA